MTASAQGIDVSHYQDRLTAAALKPYSFAFTKATDGPEILDPNFYVNWALMKAVGIHRGAYAELWSGSPIEQADRFLDVVHAGGLEPGDMLAVVASDYQGVTDAEVKAFCDHVKAAAPRCIVLVYSDLSLLPALPSCTGYPLWIAWPSSRAPRSVIPWRSWHLWQWNETNLDKNAFNGTVAELDAWISSIAYPTPPKPPADWTFGPPQRLQAIAGHITVRLTWELPGWRSGGSRRVPGVHLLG